MTLPAPRLHPDPATDDGRGDWTLILWVPVVFAVAGVRGVVRRVRARVGAALIGLGVRVMGETS